MKLKMTRFRVRNYRNINDSGWIPVEKVTALVGCNEAGKSALLKALHKFNPAVAEPYDAQREFPRDRFVEDYRNNGGEWPVCNVEFELSDEFRTELREALDLGEVPEKVVVTRYYDGSLSCEYGPDIPDDAIDPNELSKLLDNLKKEARELDDSTDASQETLMNLASWVRERKKDLKDIQNLRDEKGIALLGQVRDDASQYSQQGMAELVAGFQNELNFLLTRANGEPLSEQLDKAIEDKLPVFIYFDSYDLLNSAVYLPKFIEELSSAPEVPRIKMIKALFKSAGLNEQEIAQLANESANHGATDDIINNDHQSKALRAVKLDAASNRISQDFSKWYGQRRYKIKCCADGNYFRIWVSDDSSPDTDVELESRSKGFQWFFSFYTIFSSEADDGYKNAILLLDEPGLHLHPTAQQELLTFFDELAEKNPIIYTTHSPYLIDGKKLHRVYAVTVDKTGHAHISVDGWPDDANAIFPIKAAIERPILQELMQSQKNLLVEGATDKLYLQILSECCKKYGKCGLPEDIYVIHCRGAEKISVIASVLLDHGARPAVLLDSDDVGRRKSSSLISKLYADHKFAVLMLGMVFKRENYVIEDMIGEKIIIPALKEIAGKTIELSQNKPQKSLVDRIKTAANESNIELPQDWKYEVARHITAKWLNTGTKDVPEEVLHRAEKLFKEIAKCFNTMGQELATPAASTLDQDTTTISNKSTNSKTREEKRQRFIDAY